MRISSCSTRYLLPQSSHRRQPSNIHYKFRLLDKEALIFEIAETKKRPENLRSIISLPSETNIRCTKLFRIVRIEIYHRFYSNWILKFLSINPNIQSIYLDTTYFNMSVSQLAEIQKSIKKLPFLNALDFKFWYAAPNPKYYEAFLDFVLNTCHRIRSTSIRIGDLEISRETCTYKFAAKACSKDYQYILSKLAFFKNFNYLDLDLVLREKSTCIFGRIIYPPEHFRVKLSLWKSNSLDCIKILLAKLFHSKKIDHVRFSLAEDSIDKIYSENHNENRDALNTIVAEDNLSKLREYEIDKVDFRVLVLAFMGISPLIRSFDFIFDVNYGSLDFLFSLFKFLSRCNNLSSFVFKFYLEDYGDITISELMKGLKKFDKIDCLDAKFCEAKPRSYHVNDPSYHEAKDEEITYFSIKKDSFCKYQLSLPLFKNEWFLDTILKLNLRDLRICFEIEKDLSAWITLFPNLKDRIKGLDYLLALKIDSDESLEKYISYSKTQKIDSKLRIIEKSQRITQKLFLSFFEEINQNSWMVEEIFMEFFQLDREFDNAFFCSLIEIFKKLAFLKLLVMENKNNNFKGFDDCISHVTKIKREKLEEFCESNNFRIKFYPGFMILEKIDLF